MALVQSKRNLGRSINLITGIQGVSAGGQLSINMPVSRRVHRMNFQCTGIAWKSPTCTITGGGGSGATATVQTANGLITGFTVTAAGSGYTSVPTVNIIDEVYGYNIWSATATAVLTTQTLTSITLVSAGTVAAVPIERFFTSFIQRVNGAVMRDISSTDIMGIAAFNNGINISSTSRTGSYGLASATYGVAPLARSKYPTLGNVASSQMDLPYVIGQLTVYFSEPWRRFTGHETATAWDLIGLGPNATWQIVAGVSSSVNTPGLVGTYEFDFLRNQIKTAANAPVSYFLKPVKQHSYSFNVPAGMSNITTLDFTYPIQRMFFYGAANPYQLEIYADGIKVLEGTAEQIMQNLRDYGFNTDVYDIAAVFDIDQKLHGALKVINNLDVRIWNTSAAALTVVVESTPPAFV